MEFLLSNKLLEWPVILQEKPRCVELLEVAPKVTKYLQKKYGFDVGVGAAIVASKGELKYLGVMLLKAMIRAGLGEGEENSLAQEVSDLRATTLGRMDEVWNESVQDLWMENTRQDKVEQSQKLLQAQVKPPEEWMVDLWYQALDGERWKVLQWLNKSPKLIALVKKQWPYEADKQKNSFQMTTTVHPNKAKIRVLLNLGFDLMEDQNKHQKTPWIHKIAFWCDEDLRWIARKIPEVFDTTNAQGQTLMDRLTEEAKLMVTKEMLDKQLTGRRKKKQPQHRI